MARKDLIEQSLRLQAKQRNTKFLNAYLIKRKRPKSKSNLDVIHNLKHDA